MAKGVTVSHGDIDTGLDDYSDKRFDYVILNGSLQEVLYPKKVMLEALRVGKKVIVGMPNFCHLGSRFQIGLGGKAPITKELPYEWYESPNVHFLTMLDFRDLADRGNFRIVKELPIIGQYAVDRAWMANLRAHSALYVLERPQR